MQKHTTHTAGAIYERWIAPDPAHLPRKNTQMAMQTLPEAEEVDYEEVPEQHPAEAGRPWIVTVFAVLIWIAMMLWAGLCLFVKFLLALFTAIADRLPDPPQDERREPAAQNKTIIVNNYINIQQ